MGGIDKFDLVIGVVEYVVVYMFELLIVMVEDW